MDVADLLRLKLKKRKPIVAALRPNQKQNQVTALLLKKKQKKSQVVAAATNLIESIIAPGESKWLLSGSIYDPDSDIVDIYCYRSTKY